MLLRHLCTLAIGLLHSTTAQSLGSVLSSHSSFSILHDVLQYHNMLGDLGTTRDSTYFAPNNDALIYLADFGINLTTGDPAIARALLTYSLVHGTHSLKSVINGGEVQLVHSVLTPPLFTNVTQGQAVKLRSNNTGVSRAIALETGLQIITQVVEHDIPFEHGLIHATSTNLVLPHNISETARKGQLTEFWKLVETSGSADILESATDITLFIPHDGAIARLRPVLQMLTKDQLEAVALQHAVSGKVVYGDNIASSNQTLENMCGGIVRVHRDKRGQLFVNNARIVRQDVLLSGGVAHIIDGVLLPNTGDSCGLQHNTTPNTITNSWRSGFAKVTSRSMFSLGLVPFVALIILFAGLNRRRSMLQQVCALQDDESKNVSIADCKKC